MKNNINKKGAKSVGLTIQVPEKVCKALNALAVTRMTSRNTVVREILVAHLKLQGALQ